MDYAIHVLIMTGIYSLAVLGLRIGTCYGAQLIVAPTIAFAAGAYSVGILAGFHNWPTGWAALVGIGAGFSLGALTGLLTLRLDGDYLLLAALGACEIARSIITNFESLTGGSIGIMNIPGFIRGHTPQATQLSCLVITFAAVAACWSFSGILRNSSFGRVQIAIQDDAAGTASLGHPVRRTQVMSVAIGSAWTALAGSIFAAYSSYIDPSSFTVDEAIMMFAMFVMGGMRSRLGTVIGVSVFLFLPELLRLFAIPTEIASPIRRVLCGVLLLFIMRARLAAHAHRKRAESATFAVTGVA